MKKILLSVAAFAMICGTAQAQSFLERMKERAKETVEQNVGEKVEKGVNDLLNGKKSKKDKKKGDKEEPEARTTSWTCEECGAEGNTGNFCNECGAKRPGGEAKPKPGAKPEPKKQAESAYAKSDFVPGDEIIFEDTFEGEQLGEFPSRWDLIHGSECEVVNIKGKNAIKMNLIKKL